MAIVYDDYNAVDAVKVSTVTKPIAGTSWYLTVVSVSGPVTLWFADEGSRDDFYKRLIEAMEKG